MDRDKFTKFFLDVRFAVAEYDRRTNNVLLGLVLSPFILVGLWLAWLVASR